MKWIDIVGHVENIKMLRQMESSGRVPHALLLTGPSGIGKFMVGSVLATALLCMSSESRPCGSCQSCVHMSRGTHPDFLTIRPDGTTIKIEQIRALQHEVALAPYVSLKRVCIIDGAELMTTQAANSILKTLEEPIGDIVFILLSANRQLLLTTIISRCMMLVFQPLIPAVLAEALCDRGFLAESSEVAARLSGGRMGKALAMLEPDGLIFRNQAIDIFDGASKASMTTLWDMATQLEKMERKDILQIVSYCTYLLRDLLMIVTGQDRELLFNIDLVDWLNRQAYGWSEKKLLKALKIVETARQALHANANARLTSEALLIKIYDLVKEV
ncbi:DNA polymerase III subunit delta' [Pelosinus sp. sgz500959]|uniref:DNA polymerase III subunit delta' n=1 Tax=Pelosinus sp. sgz500959 TaxID=3242472 RepID=UPI0036715D9C